MGDKMTPYSFEELVEKLFREYEQTKTLMGVPVYRNDKLICIGPAAGPHTQLAGNLVAAYGAGAIDFELKTVQVLEGEALGIVKPCIYVGNEVYNTEWSTELTVREAADEYIKAFILIQMLAKEFGLMPAENINFIMSVGYNLEGIKSPKVDGFINEMKDASETCEWKKDIAYIKEHIGEFSKLTLEDVDSLDSKICDTVTLSTMHGCPAEEIEAIAKYLLTEKKLNTLIKMNPTLLGKDYIRRVLNQKGYKEVEFSDQIFEKDIDLDTAVKIIDSCKETADDKGVKFGIKLTNTFPVNIRNNELAGQQMYMSGPALYALSIQTAYELASRIRKEVMMSYSGGIDVENVSEVLATGLGPITVSSFLLRIGGYSNIGKLIEAAKGSSEAFQVALDIEKLKEVATKAALSDSHDKKDVRVFKRQDKYDEYCAKCHNCQDVCPNRANERRVIDGKEVVVHIDRLCNECGCCSFACIMGHHPYLEKYTL